MYGDIWNVKHTLETHYHHHHLSHFPSSGVDYT